MRAMDASTEARLAREFLLENMVSGGCEEVNEGLSLYERLINWN